MIYRSESNLCFLKHFSCHALSWLGNRQYKKETKCTYVQRWLGVVAFIFISFRRVKLTVWGFSVRVHRCVGPAEHRRERKHNHNFHSYQSTIQELHLHFNLFQVSHQLLILWGYSTFLHDRKASSFRQIDFHSCIRWKGHNRVISWRLTIISCRAVEITQTIIKITWKPVAFYFRITSYILYTTQNIQKHCKSQVSIYRDCRKSSQSMSIQCQINFSKNMCILITFLSAAIVLQCSQI